MTYKTVLWFATKATQLDTQVAVLFTFLPLKTQNKDPLVLVIVLFNTKRLLKNAENIAIENSYRGQYFQY